MSLYKELVTTKGRFAEAGKKAERPPGMKNVGAVILRMGDFKFDYAAAAYGSVIPSERVLRLDSEREEPKSWPGKPAYVAAFKAEGVGIDLKWYAKSQGLTLTDHEQAFSIGQDVQFCNDTGDPIYKPGSIASKDSIFEDMQAILCRDGDNSFRVKSGSAVFGKDKRGLGRGVMLSSEMGFTATEFTPRELELYVYGLEGKARNYPHYLTVELRRLVEDKLIDDDETALFAQGTSLYRLKQTSGGFRWPHPVFLRHITSIDNITSEQEKFWARRQDLVKSLVGASPESIALFPKMVSRLEQNAGEETWQKLAILRDGTLVCIRPIRLDDDNEVTEIANLVARNFGEHPNYASLSEEARKEYIRINNVEGIRGTASHPDNIMAVVVESDESIIAYSVVRKVNGTVAEGRRLHVHIDHQGKGIGSMLHDEKVVAARLNGCTQLGSIASGASEWFVEQRGYTTIGRQLNKKLNERGVDSHVNYALRDIT